MQQTSLDAYWSIKDRLSAKQHDVLVALKELKTATNKEIADLLGWDINRVTPRVYELRGFGWVEENARRPCSVTGRRCIEWRAVSWAG